MGYFSDAFRRLKDNSGLMGSFKQVISGVPGQSILAALNNYKDYLLTNCGPQDSLICALSSSEELIKDTFISNDQIQFFSDARDFSEIPNDICNDVINGITQAVHEGSDSTDLIGITLSDSCGRAYNIVDQRSQNVVIDNKKVLFSNTYAVSKISEAMILQDTLTGKYYLNNFIRSADFVKDGGVRVKPITILELMQSIMLIMYNWDGYSTLFENALAIADAPAEPNTMSALTDCASSLGYDGPNTMLDILNWLWDWADAQYPLPQAKGKITSIWSIVKDQVESSTMNSFILETCDAVIGGYNNATAVSSVMLKAAQSKYKSIRAFGNGISQAFNHGGVYGVACYIVSYLKELTTLKEEDGVMQFADNSKLTPQVYLAGLVQLIVTGITTLVTIIVSIFSKIAGAVLAVIGAFLSTFLKAIDYDYSATKASLNTSDKVITPTAPYGIIQREISINQIWNPDLLSLFNQGIYMNYCYIPGGCIFIGPGGFNDNNEITSVRFEFHPLICECQEAFDETIRLIGSYIWATGLGYPRLQLNVAAMEDNALTIACAVSRAYASKVADFTMDNESDNVLSNNNDLAIRKKLLQNLFIMGVYLACTTSSSIMNDAQYSQFSDLHDDDFFWLTAIDTNDCHCGCWLGFQAYCYFEIPWPDGAAHGWTLTTREDYRYDDPPSWTIISKRCITQLGSAANYDGSVPYIINGQYYFDNFASLPSNAQHAIYIPKYDAQTFWAVIVASVVITAVVSIAVAVVAVKAKKAINRKRALNQANVQSKHQQFVDNPSDETYLQYKKAVRKNNLWSNLIGGSKYDYVNYWNGDSSVETPEGATTGSLLNPFSSFSSLGSSTEIDQTSNIDAAANDGTLEISDLMRLSRLITG